MVDATQAMESSYVTVDLVRESPTKKVLFKDEGKYEEKEYDGEKILKLSVTVEIDGKTKTYSPNKDSVKNIVAEFGRDVSNWKDKSAHVRLGKVRGKDVVIAFPIPVPKTTEENIY